MEGNQYFLHGIVQSFCVIDRRWHVLRVVAASLSDFEKFLQKKLIKIEGLRDVQSSFSLRRLIHKTALPVKATV